MWGGAGFGQTNHRGGCAQRCALPADFSYHPLRDHRSYEERSSSHPRYAGCREREIECIRRGRSTVSRAGGRPDRPLPALARRTWRSRPPMSNSGERGLEAALTAPFFFGQILVRKTSADSFVLIHRDDETVNGLKTFRNVEDAIEIAQYDDAGNYRPLKTAPNLRGGWRLEINTFEKLKRALAYFYPGRLAVFAAWKSGKLQTTPLRETLDRQSGMYRVAAKISDVQINDLVADFCRSNGGCLR